MTTEEKNIEIALMLGFKKGFWYSVKKPVTEDKKQLCDFEGNNKIWKTIDYPKEKLLFHSDANWQFQCIDWIEKQGYKVNITLQRCVINSNTIDDEMEITCSSLKSKKEAIFEAIYQFSQYLKQKK